MEFKECEGCPAYCCYHHFTVATPLTDEDIHRIAKHVNMPVEQFVEEYVTLNNRVRRVSYEDAPGAVGHFKRDTPVCVFLKDSRCEINSVKPRACKDMRPKHIGNGVACSDWFRVRVGR